VLGERDGVGEHVMPHLRHHGHAPADTFRHELVHALALVERERPELPHHAAAEDPVDSECVDVVVDRRGQQVLVDVTAVVRERRRDRYPQSAHALARKRLRRAEDGRAHAGAACCFDCSMVPPK
jgi:hypothetical protein